LKLAGPPVQMQHSRRRAISEGLLGDELFGKVIIEIWNQHESDYRSTGSDVLRATAGPEPGIPLLRDCLG